MIKFDKYNKVQDFTLVLSNRNYKHHGQLHNIENLVYKRNLNSADELSFQVHKLNGNQEETLWNDIVDLKLIWIKELNEYFEIQVSTNDSSDIVKSITATSLCECELSQTLLYGIEINTEDDITRDDYVVTKFYDSENKEGSLLHRVLDKVPHYRIKHVDSSLKNLQRSFSIDGTSVYDFLTGDCAEQFHCFFLFDSTDRSISVYDLSTVCEDCGYRGEYTDICPECGSTNLKYYGEDTTILVDKENLTDDVAFETSVDSIKNCFKLKAGDDNMTAAVINLNPNGSGYIYYISDEQKKDMSTELVSKIESYDKLYDSYIDEYATITSNIYECIDKILYYESEMMPTIEQAEVTAATEAAKLTTGNLSPLGLSSVTKSTSTATVNSALKNYAKVYVKTGYVKLEIDSGEFTYVGTDGSGNSYGTWYGRFKVTNYSDEEDIAYSDYLSIKVYDSYSEFLEQKIRKNIASDDKDGNIYDVLSIKDLNKFNQTLTLYCLNRLTSFYDAIQGVIDVLIEADQSNVSADFYDDLYLPYYNKLQACQKEIDKRQKTINGYLTQQDTLESQKEKIQKILDFDNYLGEELFLEFCAYRREDTYSNDNFISDGLNNAEIFENAQEFLDLAKTEIVKSGEYQHSISTTLYNLLLMEEFKPIIDKFEVGNWIRIAVENDIYRLRLVSYEIAFNDVQKITTEFSDLTQTASGMNDIRSILSEAKSMASSYSYVAKQSNKGNEAQENINAWIDKGLNSAAVQIKNNDTEEITYGKHGLLARSYDDITDSYLDEQLKITHNILAFTEDNWQTSSLGLGKHPYTYYDGSKFVSDIGYGLSAKFCQSSYISGSQIIGGDIYSENYSSTAGTHIDLNSGNFSFAGGNLKYDGSKLKFNGEIITNIGTIGGFTINSNAIYNGTNSKTSKNAGIYLGTDAIRAYTSANAYTHIENGVLTCTGANIEGAIYSNEVLYMKYHEGDQGEHNSTHFVALKSDFAYDATCLVIGDGAHSISLTPDWIDFTGLSFDSNTNTCYSYTNFNLGSTTNSFGQIYASNWFRSIGNTGWYNQTYGGGIYMTDSDWVRVSHSKRFLVSNVLRADGEIQSTYPNSYRQVQGNYGTFWRNDGSNLWLMFTSSGNQYGGYNNLRPMHFNLSNGNCTLGHNCDVAGSLSANGTITGNGGVCWGEHQCVYSVDNSVAWLRNCSNAYMEVQTSSTLFGVNWFVSDARLKKNIEETTVTALDYINQIDHKQFDWKQEGREGVRCGYVAQQLEEIDLDVTFKIKQPEGSEIDELYQIDSTRLMPYLTKAIQELSAQVKNLQNQIDILKK